MKTRAQVFLLILGPLSFVAALAVMFTHAGISGVASPEELPPAPTQTAAPRAADHPATPSLAAAPQANPAGAAPPQAPPAPAPAPNPGGEPGNPALFHAEVAESQRRAIAKHSDLGQLHSEINSRFLFRYNRMRAANDPRLSDAGWPEKLADDCAAAKY